MQFYKNPNYQLLIVSAELSSSMANNNKYKQQLLILKVKAFINAMNYNLLIISYHNIHVMINDKLYDQLLGIFQYKNCRK